MGGSRSHIPSHPDVPAPTLYQWYSIGDPKAAVKAYELRRGRRPPEILCNPADEARLRQVLGDLNIVVPTVGVVLAGTILIPA